MGHWDRMHRDHRFSQRLMPDAMDGELSTTQRARFARHVDECPECGPMLRGLIRVRAALRSIADTQPPSASVAPTVIERLHSEIRADEDQESGRRSAR